MSEVIGLPMDKLSDDDIVELVKDHLQGKPIYIRFVASHELRAGSIAVIKEWTPEYGLTKNGSPMIVKSWRGRWHTPQIVNFKIGKDAYTLDLGELGFYSLRAKWVGRKNECDFRPEEVEWLQDYSGPCIWQYGRAEQPKVPALDRLGREIKVGDFTCYILHHFGQNYGASTQFGTVTKVENDGTVWAKNIALGDGETAAIKKINDNGTVVILTKDLMDQLMMAKLSSF